MDQSSQVVCYLLGKAVVVGPGPATNQHHTGMGILANEIPEDGLPPEYNIDQLCPIEAVFTLLCIHNTALGSVGV
ncbi:hypothetical protein ACFWBV_30435 [Streptomyces sp. NPDC060030]|uniref:hypothetical protein n=1 Tax=Streptomyces sp. NPDC060030 TaxID=3347042 RepID=UPI003690890B